MFHFTAEEKRIILFLLLLAFSGLAINSLVKINSRIERIVYPQVQLAKVNLNRVGLEELTGLKCIPEKLARRVIEYRNLRQQFTSLEELKDVKGIGEKRYEKLKGIFFVE